MSTNVRGLTYIWKVSSVDTEKPFTKEDGTTVQKFKVNVVIEGQSLSLDASQKPDLFVGKTYMLPVGTRSVLAKDKTKAYTFFFLRNDTKPIEVV